MDPVSILGATSSIFSIAEVLSKAIGTLHEMHTRWQEAGFTFLGLISQITAFKVALGKI